MKRISAVLLFALIAFIGCADYDLLETREPEPVELEIIGVSDTTVTLRWSRSGAEDFRSYAVYYDFGKNDIVDSADKLADTLYFAQDTQKTVWNLDPETRYYFRVIVNTRHGMIAPSNIVDTMTLPDSKTREIVLSVDSLSVTDVSLTLRWRDSRGEGPYRVSIDTTHTVDSTDTALIETRRVNDDTSQTIIGLKPSTGYWLRVYGLDEGGRPLTGSNTVQVTTRASEPDSVTLSVIDSTVTDTSVTLRWTANTNRDFLRYIVRCDTLHIADTIIAEAERDMTIETATDTSATLSGLSDSTTYFVRVFVEDSLHYLSAGDQDSFTTLSSVPKPVVPTLIDGSETDTSVILRWTANQDRDFYRYVVRYATTTIPDTFTAVTAADKTFDTRGDTTDTLTGLEDSTTYFVRVFVEDSAGFVSTGEEDTFTTLAGVPEAVTLELDRETLTDSTVELRWTRTTAADFAAYEIYWDTTASIDTTAAGSEIVTDSNATTITVTLDELDRYRFAVYVRDTDGKCAKSNEVENYAVVLYEPVERDSTTIDLAWSKYLGDGFQAYKLYRSDSPGVTATTKPLVSMYHVAETDCRDTSRVPGETYYYRVFV
jgi:hypothetical protein